jgi:arylsulfatase/uncharacterized sulfatase
MKRLLAAAALLAHLLAGAAPVRPNIVVLVADDWGFTDVGAFGGEIPTPHLDALAARGARFANFHTSASCSPTRSMLLTGVDHHRNGVGSLRESMPRAHVGQPGYEGELNERVVTVGTLLQDAGYRTHVVGKWNVGGSARNLPDRRGFHRSLVLGDTGADNWDPQQRYLPHTATVSWYADGQPAGMPRTFYSSRFFVDKAIEFLQADAKAGQPFFTYIGFQANHLPVQAPAEFVARHKGRYDAGWAALRAQRRDRAAALGVVPADTALAPTPHAPDWTAQSPDAKRLYARQMEVYAGMAEAMDHEVGRLVAHLKQTGQYDNTVFVFLSDNGAEGSDPYAVKSARPWLWSQGYSQDHDRLGGPGTYGVIGPGWATAAASPLATYKFYSGEGGIRVPLIVAGAPGTEPGRIHHAFTHVLDIAPTLLDLAGVPAPGSAYQGRATEPMSGRSLGPLLRGEADHVHPADEAVGFELTGNAALFKGDLKLVKVLPPLGDGQWRLFDIRRDPGETRDLRAQRPEDFKAMFADYETYARKHGVLPVPDDYDPVRQVAINNLLDYFVPTYGPWVLGALSLAAAGWIALRRRLLAGPRP